MTVLEPWQTAWPAGAALLVLLTALVAGRRHLAIPSRDRAPAVLFVVAALALRLLFVPAWTDHLYDGHEAEYWDLFRGVRAPTRGGTVLYPAMQWLWWGLGRVLPHGEVVPVGLMALAGTAAAGLAGAALGRIGGRRVGWLAAVLIAVHPAHCAWSTSAYNVILPQLMGALTLWCAATLATSRRPPASLAWLGAAAWALVAATRMEAALVGLVAFLLVLVLRSEGAPPRARQLLRWLPAALVGLALAALAAWPLVFPGEVPGAGERALSWRINVGLLDYHAPYDGIAGLALLALSAALALRRHPRVTAVMIAFAVAHHLVLASFDDYGERHALGALVPLAWLLAAGGASLGRAWPALPLAAGALSLAGLVDLRGRFYGSEEAFAHVLAEPPWDTLPRVGLDEARQGCAWVNEDHRVAATPVISHFNLLDPAEEARLRGAHGCLRWCLDVQDWRWSSRSVRDRALRLQHMFVLEPIAVVEEPPLGYSCLVLEVGPRLVGRLSRPAPERDEASTGPAPRLP